jgi:protein-glutamine gamma-glutamyltransferase
VRPESGAGAVPPRPLSAFALVATSGAALALTGELGAPTLGANALAFATALALRRRTRAWQHSAWLLNLGLAAALVFAGSLWLGGALAVVALAHFAHLAQGLQLLDARPRRSDFLIVALALFQMLLAANLTDSLLFPLLLAVFAFTAVWTLMAHTLWMEEIAAGAAAAGPRAPARELVATAAATSAAALVVAAAIFVMLPRMRGGALGASALLGSPAAGFSDRIELGDLGRIRRDPNVVLRVETLRGNAPPPEAAYWRGLAFDHFDGRSWSITPPARTGFQGTADLGMTLDPRAREGDRVQRIVREPVTAGVIFAAGRPVQIEGGIGHIQRDRNGGLYATRSPRRRIDYTIETQSERLPDADLRADRATPPADAGERYLELPPLSPAVPALAERVVAGATNDAERVRAVERYLLDNGRYSDTPPPLDAGEAPLDHFLLGETDGHCEYFASGMVVLLRSIGIPARLVNGFAGGRENAIGGFVELTRADAHAWVEVHYERAGWVRYDPTPPDLRLRGAAFGWGERLHEVGAAVEHWWYQSVVEFDRSRQLRALRAGWLAWHGWRKPRAAAARESTERPARPPLFGWRAPLGAALAGAAGFAAAGAARRRRRRRGGVPPAYAAALRLLARRGLRRQRSVPARAFAASAGAALPPPAAEAFGKITELYLAERFGGRSGDESRATLRALRDSLRE